MHDTKMSKQQEKSKQDPNSEKDPNSKEDIKRKQDPKDKENPNGKQDSKAKQDPKSKQDDVNVKEDPKPDPNAKKGQNGKQDINGKEDPNTVNNFQTDAAVFGLEFAFRLGDPLLPGEKIPNFRMEVLGKGNKPEEMQSQDFRGKPLVVLFHAGACTDVADNALDLVKFVKEALAKSANDESKTDSSVDQKDSSGGTTSSTEKKPEDGTDEKKTTGGNDLKELDFLVVSTDTMEVIGAWSLDDKSGTKYDTIFVSDMNGNIAKTFGVLDIKDHKAYNSIFLIDKKGIVQYSITSGMQDMLLTSDNWITGILKIM